MSARRARAVLALEFAFGVLPTLAFCVYFFPVGMFWVRGVLELVRDGTANFYTTAIAIIMLAGGLGLLSLCILMLSRWTRGSFSSRVLLAGLILGMAASLGILIFRSIIGSYWIEYYLFGAPLLVGAHQFYSELRSRPSSRATGPAVAAR